MFNLRAHRVLLRGRGGAMEGTRHALHVVERVEEGIDELCGLDEESGELVLHCGVDVVVFVRRDLKVLFQLRSSQAIRTWGDDGEG